MAEAPISWRSCTVKVVVRTPGILRQVELIEETAVFAQVNGLLLHRVALVLGCNAMHWSSCSTPQSPELMVCIEAHRATTTFLMVLVCRS
jgi:hypothetical protein